MAALLLHGIVAHTDNAVAPEGSETCLIPFADGLSALASPADVEPLDALATARRHHALLTEWCQDRDVLPVRLGTAFSSTDRLRQAMGARADKFRNGLRRVGNRLEYSLSLHRVPNCPDSSDAKHAPSSGRAFLQQRHAERRREAEALGLRRGFMERLRSEVLHPQIAFTELQPRDETCILKVAVLVARNATKGFIDAADSLNDAGAVLGLRLAAVGPGPCYSFAEPDSADACASELQNG